MENLKTWLLLRDSSPSSSLPPRERVQREERDQEKIWKNLELGFTTVFSSSLSLPPSLSLLSATPFLNPAPEQEQEGAGAGALPFPLSRPPSSSRRSGRAHALSAAPGAARARRRRRSSEGNPPALRSKHAVERGRGGLGQARPAAAAEALLRRPRPVVVLSSLFLGPAAEALPSLAAPLGVGGLPSASAAPPASPPRRPWRGRSCGPGGGVGAQRALPPRFPEPPLLRAVVPSSPPPLQLEEEEEEEEEEEGSSSSTARSHCSTSLRSRPVRLASAATLICRLLSPAASASRAAEARAASCAAERPAVGSKYDLTVKGGGVDDGDATMLPLLPRRCSMAFCRTPWRPG